MTTYVLVHGAYQGSWVWKFVSERLIAAGHRVYAPTLDGCAERNHQLRPGITVDTHALEVARLLFYEDLNDVELVGTSTSGMVISKAAELARERIGRLAFVDALALLPGERVFDILQLQEGVARSMSEVSMNLPRANLERTFADLDAARREWIIERWSAHPAGTVVPPMVPTAFWEQSWRALVIWCSRSPNPPESHQRRTANLLKGEFRQIATGHYPMLSEPDELARLLMA